MSKPEMGRERMLATLATLLQVYVQSEKRIPEMERDLKDGAIIAIRALIEKGKPIPRDFVEKWLINFTQPSTEGLKEQICTMLYELGHEIEEEE